MRINTALARYLPAPVLVNLGIYIHVLLFNLYLADRGFREDFMGRQTAFMTMGAALGTIPTAAIARRFGLRFASVLTTLGLAVALLLRAQTSGILLSVASVLMGLCLGGWNVTNSPSIAALSAGTTGFSLNIGLPMAIGTVGGLLGGRLPGWMHAIVPSADSVSTARLALMVAPIPVLCATAVLAGVRYPTTPPAPATRYRVPQFLWRFLPAVALWYAFSAGFIPFFNVYLRNHLGQSTARIGGAYAFSQIVQASATLLMPLLIAWFGLVRSVVSTQIAASLGVLALLQAQTLPQATLFYTIYISLQVMSEPGLMNLLMRGVPVADRPAASAANLLLVFGINASVGALAGRLIVASGYATLFIALSITGVLAALLFAFLLRDSGLSESERAA